jgi:hypothetical protein
MLPIFANTMELLKDNVPQLMTAIHVAPNQHVENFIGGAVHKWPVPVVLIPGGTTHMRYDAFSVRPVVPLDFHLHNKFVSGHYVDTYSIEVVENWFILLIFARWQLFL